MSTAIVRTYTTDGFVIAADGRKTKQKDDGLIFISDDNQKIFSIEEVNLSLGYALSGTVQIETEDDSGIAFDFINEIARSVQDLAGRRTRSLAGYGTRLCRSVNVALASAKNAGVNLPWNGRSRRRFTIPLSGCDHSPRGAREKAARIDLRFDVWCSL